MGLDKIGSQQIQFPQVEKHLTRSLTAGTEGKVGKAAYIGKVFSNLKKNASAIFHRIEALFEKGTWVTNKSVMDRLDNRFKELTQILEEGVDGEIADVIASGVTTMRRVCDVLKKGGVELKSVDQLNAQLDNIEDLVKKVPDREAFAQNRRNEIAKELEDIVTKRSMKEGGGEAFAQNRKNEIAKELEDIVTKSRMKEAGGEAVIKRRRGQQGAEVGDIGNMGLVTKGVLKKTLTNLLKLADQFPKFRESLQDARSPYNYGDTDSADLDKFLDNASFDGDPKEIFNIIKTGLVETGQAKWTRGGKIRFTDSSSQLSKAYDEASKAIGEQPVKGSKNKSQISESLDRNFDSLLKAAGLFPEISIKKGEKYSPSEFLIVLKEKLIDEGKAIRNENGDFEIVVNKDNPETVKLAKAYKRLYDSYSSWWDSSFPF